MVNKMLKMLMNDLVTLVKASGQRFENLPAAVQAGKIFTQDPTVPIEDGDTFERKIPSGIVEVFVVLDAGFRQGTHGRPGHYQSQVEKSTARPKPSTTQQVVYTWMTPGSDRLRVEPQCQLPTFHQSPVVLRPVANLISEGVVAFAHPLAYQGGERWGWSQISATTPLPLRFQKGNPG